MTSVLHTRRLRLLELAGGDVKHLSAASGLVRVGRRFYVVADDELSLGAFLIEGDAPGTLLQLAAGTLPQGHAARKAAKPDCEALTLLPAQTAYPHGALLALGSGSRPTRERGFVLPLDILGQTAGAPEVVDLAPLYAPLRAEFGDLNIEGAFVTAGRLTLLQRGNRGDGRNAGIDFDASAFAGWLAGDGPAPAAAGHALFDLGDIKGVPLGFTDGAALGDDGAWVFSAAAEDTGSSYNDGACLGSVVGVVDRTGRMVLQARLATVCKVEGVALQANANANAEAEAEAEAEADGSVQLLLVTDADDRNQPAHLLSCRLPKLF